MVGRPSLKPSIYPQQLHRDTKKIYTQPAPICSKNCAYHNTLPTKERQGKLLFDNNRFQRFQSKSHFVLSIRAFRLEKIRKFLVVAQKILLERNFHIKLTELLLGSDLLQFRIKRDQITKLIFNISLVMGFSVCLVHGCH
jgi:hypothetical protein